MVFSVRRLTISDPITGVAEDVAAGVTLEVATDGAVPVLADEDVAVDPPRPPPPGRP